MHEIGDCEIRKRSSIVHKRLFTFLTKTWESRLDRELTASTSIVGRRDKSRIHVAERDDTHVLDTEASAEIEDSELKMATFRDKIKSSVEAFNASNALEFWNSSTILCKNSIPPTEMWENLKEIEQKGGVSVDVDVYSQYNRLVSYLRNYRKDVPRRNGAAENEAQTASLVQKILNNHKELLGLMAAEERYPSTKDFNGLLKLFSIHGSLEATEKLFEDRHSFKVQADIYSYSIFLKGYATCDRRYPSNVIMGKCRDVMTSMKEEGIAKSTRMYNHLLEIYISQGEFLDVRNFFDEMRSNDITPDEISYCLVFERLSTETVKFRAIEKLRVCWKLLQDMEEYKIVPTLRIYLSILRLCKTANDPKGVETLLQEMTKNGFRPNRVFYNRVLNVIAEGTTPENATRSLLKCLSILDSMKKNEIPLDVGTYNTWLKVCLRGHLMEDGRIVLGDMKRNGVKPNGYSYTTMLSIISANATKETAAGLINEAFELLDIMSKQRLHTENMAYNIVLFICATGGLVHDAKRLLRRMRGEKVTPDEHSYASALKVFVTIATKSNGYDCMLKCWELVSDMRKDGITPGGQIYGTLLKVCRAGGLADSAVNVLGEMKRIGLILDPSTHITIMQTFAEAATADTAADALKRCRQTLKNMEGIKQSRNSGAFDALLTTCSKGGLKEEMIETFEEMTSRQVAFSGSIFCLMVDTYAAIVTPMTAEAVIGECRASVKRFRPKTLKLNTDYFISLLNLYDCGGKLEEALGIFDEIRDEGMKVDYAFVERFLQICISNKKTEYGPKVYAKMKEYRLTYENAYPSLQAKMRYLRTVEKDLID